MDASDQSPLFTASWAWTLKAKQADASNEVMNKRPDFMALFHFILLF
jgi:hypothetical protein